MPFCCQCGCQVGDASHYCSKCGAPSGGCPGRGGFRGRDESAHRVYPVLHPLGRLDCRHRRAGLSTFRTNRTVRFHAFQGLYLFVAGCSSSGVHTLAFFDRGPHIHLAGLLEMAILALWIFMIVKTSQGRSSRCRDRRAAEKSLSE